MARDFEIIGAGAIGALLHRKAKHAPEPGALCANCQTALAGPYCHVCGQDADDRHRSIWRLIWEGVEGLTHLDGRVAQTLPLLLFRPGKLARDQMEGRRARHVPPFRLFLVSLLAFMFVLEGVLHSAPVNTVQVGHPPAGAAAPTVLSFSDGPLKTPADRAKQAAAVDKALKAVAAARAARKSRVDVEGPLKGWLKPRLERAIANRDYYSMVAFTWAHRLAILLLPILGLLLALAYIRRRGFFLYDHLIVAMQFLSFEFLVFAVAWLIPDPGRDTAMTIAGVWTPVNLFMTLRGAYRSGVVAAMLKTLFLWASTLFLFAVLMVGLMILALAEM